MGALHVLVDRDTQEMEYSASVSNHAVFLNLHILLIIILLFYVVSLMYRHRTYYYFTLFC